MMSVAECSHTPSGLYLLAFASLANGVVKLAKLTLALLAPLDWRHDGMSSCSNPRSVHVGV
jgi:hypothetical protein